MKRLCLNCGSTTTYVDKRGWTHWRHYKDGFLCHRCESRLIWNPILNKKWNKITNAKWHPINDPKRIRFKDKRIILKENPRTGICSLCRSQGLTHIHHIKYHEDDPLRDTIELCNRCHKIEHIKT